MLRANRFLMASCAGSAMGLGSFYSQDDKTRRKTVGLFNATGRIINLVRTTGLIAADYGYVLYWKDREFRAELHSHRQKLRSMQEEQDALHIKLFKLQKNRPDIISNSISSESREELLNRLLIDIEENEKVLRTLSSHVAELVLTTKERYSAIHTRNAVRLRDMCAKNKGLYIKLGQHIAMLDYVFPVEYHTILTSLLANNPQSSFQSVQQTFQEDFGVPLDSMFSTFEPVPFASASLAQVHRATLKDSQHTPVAVKIQHEGLLEGSTLDRYVITQIIDHFLPFFFPNDFNYTWLTREMNANLPQELNFVNERENIEKCQVCLSRLIQTQDVALPTPKLDLCSQRVLTMSYEEGVYVTNKTKIVEEWGLNVQQISESISKVFCEQIYRGGFVHCDPHEANLLVRPHPTIPHRAQIVLLDHGLYRQLKEEFRLDYCHLWQGLLLCDEGQIEEYCRKLGAGDMYSLLAAMLTLKPWNEIVNRDRNNSSSNNSSSGDNEQKQGIDRFAGRNTQAQQVMLQSYAAQYFKEIVQLLGTVPSDLLLLFKTNDCLRHLDHVLGTPVNSTQVVAEVVADVILHEEISHILKSHSTLFTTLQALWKSLLHWTTLQSRVLMLKMLRLWLSWKNAHQNYLSGYMLEKCL